MKPESFIIRKYLHLILSQWILSNHWSILNQILPTSLLTQCSSLPVNLQIRQKRRDSKNMIIWLVNSNAGFLSPTQDLFTLLHINPNLPLLLLHAIRNQTFGQ